jgi:hypothetical protein
LNSETEFIANLDGPYSTTPNRPGILYYAVNDGGTEFWLTVSGLNVPFAEHAAMLRVGEFQASKQPWGDLFVTSDVIRREGTEKVPSY